MPEADALEQRIPVGGSYEERDDRSDGPTEAREGITREDPLRHEDRRAAANRPPHDEVDAADWLDQNTLEPDFEDDRTV